MVGKEETKNIIKNQLKQYWLYVLILLKVIPMAAILLAIVKVINDVPENTSPVVPPILWRPGVKVTSESAARSWKALSPLLKYIKYFK